MSTIGLWSTRNAPGWKPVLRVVHILVALVGVAIATPAFSATNDLTSQLQKGLFEEEANRNLDAAIAAYQSLVAQLDKDRQVAATALFRLGECYRKLGKTNEAAVQYERIVRDFSDQQALVTLSRQNLVGLGAGGGARPALGDLAVTPALSASGRARQRNLLQEEINVVEAKLADQQKLANNGVVNQMDLASTKQELLQLKRQFAALEDDAQAGALTTDEEEQEIRRIQVMTRNSPDLINAPDPSGSTPLLNAAGQGQLSVARYLLDHGATPDVRGTRATRADRTPLFEAVQNGHRAMVELLLDRGADVNAKVKGETPLYQAASRGFTGVIETLLAHKARVNEPSAPSENTPLHSDMALQNPTLAGLLISKGADVNARNDRGDTPLHRAIVNGKTETVPILITAGAAVNAKNNGGDTPLHLAATAGLTNAALQLITAGADLAATNGLGRTPLHNAVYPRRSDSRFRDMVAILLDHSAPVDALDNQKSAPLVQAIASENVEQVKLLLDHKADPNRSGWATFGGGNTSSAYPIYFALITKNSETLKLLLEHGADPEKSSPSERDPRPLETAVVNGFVPAVELLLQFKANPNKAFTDGDGSPPLHAACRSDKSLEMVRLLLDAGADLNARSLSGGTSLGAAIAYSRTEVARLMMERGADVNARDNYGNMALHLATLNGNQAVVESLISHHADVNAQNQFGYSPLDLASRGVETGNIPYSLLYPATPGGGNSVNKTSIQTIASVLREHGARTDLPRRDRIEVRRPSANYSRVVFSKGTNDWNEYSLLELIGSCYELIYSGVFTPGLGPPPGANARSVWSGNPFRFPDLRRVVIHRPAADGKSWKPISVDVEAILRSGDCSHDIWLEWGDVVEIPERDHLVNEVWLGPSPPDMAALVKCLSRKFIVQIQGVNSDVNVGPQYSSQPTGSDDSHVELQGASFRLRRVLDYSRLIRFSSDLSRVKVIRRNARTGKNREWILDCSDPSRSPDLWLQDGDVIEVPEKP